MAELNVESKINAYIGKNPELKKLPKSQVVSIMLKQGIITTNDAQTWYASMENSANSQKHNSAEIDVQPKEPVKRSSDNVLFGGKQPANHDVSKPFFQRTENTETGNNTLGWEKFANPKPKYTKFEKTAVEFLTQMTSDASHNISTQDAKDGFISKWIVNLYKETVNSTNAKSNVKKAIEDTKQDISQLALAASGALDSQDWRGKVNKVTFEDTFKKLRGVEFNETNIQNCQKKAVEMANVQTMKDMTDKLKQTLDSATVNSVQNAGYADANAAIMNTFKMLGMGSTGKINAALKDIEEKCKDNPEINKYGGDFRISKNKAGKYIIYRTAKNGLPAEATMEELQVIAKEMKGRINTAFGSAIGAEIPENASSEQLEKITQDTYQLHKSEYEQVFEKAYGKKDLKEMSEKYMQSQQEGTAYIEMAVNMASMAAMFVGSGVLVQGAKLGLKVAAGVDKVAKVTNFVSKAEKTLKAAEAVTVGASKVMPAVMATQIAQPVKLVENLTADESDWGTYFSSVAESGMWMALGMATGAVGDKARLFLGQKGLAKVAKDSGKSISELVDIYKSGGELPANLTKALKLIDNTAKVGGTSLEFTADVLMTYGIQKGLRGEDVTTMDYLMSANGAIMGTMMHNSFAKLAEKDKIKAIQNSLLETNPKISKAELESASKELLELHRVLELKKHETSKQSNESPEVTVVKEKSGDVSSSEKTVEHSSAQNKDKFTLPDIPDAAYLSESNADIASIKLSTKDKIKEFISPSENPFGALGEKQLQYVFDNNAKPHVQEQFGKAFDSIIAHAEESGVLKEKSDNVDFYKQYVLPDGTILFRNAIKDAPGNAKMRNCPKEVITVITPDGNNSFLVANSAENISKANKLISLMSRMDNTKNPPFIEKKFVETVPLVIKTEGKGLVLSEAGEKQVRSKAEEFASVALESESKIVKLMEQCGLGVDKETMTHRPKCAQSLFDKIKNAMTDKDNPMSFEKAVKTIKDAVGTRTVLDDFDYKSHSDIVEMYKTNPKKAFEMACERQSQEMVDKVEKIILAQVENKSDISAIRLTNYMGKNGIPYFSDTQVAHIRDVAAKNGVDLSIRDKTTKIRPSGYTALQMNFVTKDGFTFEWQLRGSKVNKFAECEHVPYDARENKDLTGGNEKLKALYAPIEKVIKSMSPEQYDEYNKYLTAHYEYLRKLELGFESEKPVLSNEFDQCLNADNLEVLHDVAKQVKKNEISEETALTTYNKNISTNQVKSNPMQAGHTTSIANEKLGLKSQFLMPRWLTKL